ncbi:MAG: serine hydrolase domain-containing protein [Frankiaceae bacterium]
MALPPVDPAEVGFDANRLRRIDRHFARYVDDGRLPGYQLLVTRRGRTVFASAYGYRDVAAKLPVSEETLYRIYSMTKPITAVAALMLYEEGAFDLLDPLSAYLPAFAAPRVYVGGPPEQPISRPAVEPIRLWHLFTHTAGLTYGSNRTHPVDAMYRGPASNSTRRPSWTSPPVPTPGPACRCCSIPVPPGTTPSPPMSWARRRSTQWDVDGRLSFRPHLRAVEYVGHRIRRIDGEPKSAGPAVHSGPDVRASHPRR